MPYLSTFTTLSVGADTRVRVCSLGPYLTTKAEVDIAKMSMASNSQPSVMLPGWTKEPGFPNVYSFSQTHKPSLEVVSMHRHQDLENVHGAACLRETRYSLPVYPKAGSYPAS